MSKYYVYIHKNPKTLEVFYVGKGTGDRYKKNQSRSLLWKDYVRKNGFIAEVIHSDLSEQEAEQLESKYITDPPKHWKLLNFYVQRRLAYKKEYFINKFQYSPESPSKLVNQKGKFVGSLTSTGYYAVNYKGVQYRVHRIIYALIHGDVDEFLTINHIDGNSLNNSIENLELVTTFENSSRCKAKVGKLRSDNTSGYSGLVDQYQRSRFVVSQTIDQKRHVTYFKYNSENKETIRINAIDLLNNIKKKNNK